MNPPGDALASLQTTGFALIPGVLSEQQCLGAEMALAGMDAESAGTRDLLLLDWCAELACWLRAQPALMPCLSDLVAVQCTYFDKTPAANWLVPVHQDLSIPVRARVEHPQLRGWAVKQGMVFVQPPSAVLDGLVAVRVHIDASGEDNGPLRVVPGSHQAGRLADPEQAELRAQRGEVPCLSLRGGVMVMKPLLLHASSKSIVGRPRRVLHFLYGPRELPFGLEWATAI